jgi:hypothetical protein
MRLAALVLPLIAATAPALAEPKDLVNAEWVIPANGAQSETFTAVQEMTLRAEVTGVKNTAKGFRVRVVNSEDATSCRTKGGTCRELTGWRQPSGTSFTQTDKIPPGRWSFMVENAMNLMKSATIRVHLTVQ